MKNRLYSLPFLMLILILTGCVGPQHFRDKRITLKQEAFNSFSPETQAKVHAGQIDIGFSQVMVYIAWGEADRIYSRITKQGEATVWDYISTRVRTESRWVSIPVRELDKKGNPVIRYRSFWIDKDAIEKYTVARVEFIDGLVSAIEKLQ